MCQPSLRAGATRAPPIAAAFLPLYPIGVLAEMWLLYSAIPYASNKNINSISLPNMGNVSFHYPTFLKVLLVVYFPLW